MQTRWVYIRLNSFVDPGSTHVPSLRLSSNMSVEPCLHQTCSSGKLREDFVNSSHALYCGSCSERMKKPKNQTALQPFRYFDFVILLHAKLVVRLWYASWRACPIVWTHALVEDQLLRPKCWCCVLLAVRWQQSYLVDPASSHMLVSKIKPCMSKYKQLYTVKLRTAHYISNNLFDGFLLHG